MYDNMQYNADFHQALGKSESPHRICTLLLPHRPACGGFQKSLGSRNRTNQSFPGWFQDPNLAEIWEFPEMGVPPNPFIDGLSIMN